MTATSRKTLAFPQRTPPVPFTPPRRRPVAWPVENRPADQKLVERVRREFSDLRGLSPTVQQARRLFHLGDEECSEIFAQLVQEGFLDLCTDQRYRMASVRRRGQADLAK